MQLMDLELQRIPRELTHSLQAQHLGSIVYMPQVGETVLLLTRLCARLLHGLLAAMGHRSTRVPCEHMG